VSNDLREKAWEDKRKRKMDEIQKISGKEKKIQLEKLNES